MHWECPRCNESWKTERAFLNHLVGKCKNLTKLDKSLRKEYKQDKNFFSESSNSLTAKAIGSKRDYSTDEKRRNMLDEILELRQIAKGNRRENRIKQSGQGLEEQKEDESEHEENSKASELPMYKIELTFNFQDQNNLESELLKILKEYTVETHNLGLKLVGYDERNVKYAAKLRYQVDFTKSDRNFIHQTLSCILKSYGGTVVSVEEGSVIFHIHIWCTSENDGNAEKFHHDVLYTDRFKIGDLDPEILELSEVKGQGSHVTTEQIKVSFDLSEKGDLKFMRESTKFCKRMKSKGFQLCAIEYKCEDISDQKIQSRSQASDSEMIVEESESEGVKAEVEKERMMKEDAYETESETESSHVTEDTDSESHLLSCRSAEMDVEEHAERYKTQAVNKPKRHENWTRLRKQLVHPDKLVTLLSKGRLTDKEKKLKAKSELMRLCQRYVPGIMPEAIEVAKQYVKHCKGTNETDWAQHRTLDYNNGVMADLVAGAILDGNTDIFGKFPCRMGKINLMLLTALTMTKDPQVREEEEKTPVLIICNNIGVAEDTQKSLNDPFVLGPALCEHDGLKDASLITREPTIFRKKKCYETRHNYLIHVTTKDTLIKQYKDEDPDLETYNTFIFDECDDYVTGKKMLQVLVGLRNRNKGSIHLFLSATDSLDKNKSVQHFVNGCTKGKCVTVELHKPVYYDEYANAERRKHGDKSVGFGYKSHAIIAKYEYEFDRLGDIGLNDQRKTAEQLVYYGPIPDEAQRLYHLWKREESMRRDAMEQFLKGMKTHEKRLKVRDPFPEEENTSGDFAYRNRKHTPSIWVFVPDAHDKTLRDEIAKKYKPSQTESEYKAAEINRIHESMMVKEREEFMFILLQTAMGGGIKCETIKNDFICWCIQHLQKISSTSCYIPIVQYQPNGHPTNPFYYQKEDGKELKQKILKILRPNSEKRIDFAELSRTVKEKLGPGESLKYQYILSEDSNSVLDPEEMKQRLKPTTWATKLTQAHILRVRQLIAKCYFQLVSQICTVLDKIRRKRSDAEPSHPLKKWELRDLFLYCNKGILKDIKSVKNSKRAFEIPRLAEGLEEAACNILSMYIPIAIFSKRKSRRGWSVPRAGGALFALRNSVNDTQSTQMMFRVFTGDRRNGNAQAAFIITVFIKIPGESNDKADLYERFKCNLIGDEKKKGFLPVHSVTDVGTLSRYFVGNVRDLADEMKKLNEDFARYWEEGCALEDLEIWMKERENVTKEYLNIKEDASKQTSTDNFYLKYLETMSSATELKENGIKAVAWKGKEQEIRHYWNTCDRSDLTIQKQILERMKQQCNRGAIPLSNIKMFYRTVHNQFAEISCKEIQQLYRKTQALGSKSGAERKMTISESREMISRLRKMFEPLHKLPETVSLNCAECRDTDPGQIIFEQSVPSMCCPLQAQKIFSELQKMFKSFHELTDVSRWLEKKKDILRAWNGIADTLEYIKNAAHGHWIKDCARARIGDLWILLNNIELPNLDMKKLKNQPQLSALVDKAITQEENDFEISEQDFNALGDYVHEIIGEVDLSAVLSMLKGNIDVTKAMKKGMLLLDNGETATEELAEYDTTVQDLTINAKYIQTLILIESKARIKVEVLDPSGIRLGLQYWKRSNLIGDIIRASCEKPRDILLKYNHQVLLAGNTLESAGITWGEAKLHVFKPEDQDISPPFMLNSSVNSEQLMQVDASSSILDRRSGGGTLIKFIYANGECKELLMPTPASAKEVHEFLDDRKKRDIVCMAGYKIECEGKHIEPDKIFQQIPTDIKVTETSAQDCSYLIDCDGNESDESLFNECDEGKHYSCPPNIIEKLKDRLKGNPMATEEAEEKARKLTRKQKNVAVVEAEIGVHETLPINPVRFTVYRRRNMWTVKYGAIKKKILVDKENAKVRDLMNQFKKETLYDGKMLTELCVKKESSINPLQMSLGLNKLSSQDDILFREVPIDDIIEYPVRYKKEDLVQTEGVPFSGSQWMESFMAYALELFYPGEENSCVWEMVHMNNTNVNMKQKLRDAAQRTRGVELHPKYPPEYKIPFTLVFQINHSDKPEEKECESLEGCRLSDMLPDIMVWFNNLVRKHKELQCLSLKHEKNLLLHLELEKQNKIEVDWDSTVADLWNQAESFRRKNKRNTGIVLHLEHRELKYIYLRKRVRQVQYVIDRKVQQFGEMPDDLVDRSFEDIIDKKMTSAKQMLDHVPKYITEHDLWEELEKAITCDKKEDLDRKKDLLRQKYDELLKNTLVGDEPHVLKKLFPVVDSKDTRHSSNQLEDQSETSKSVIDELRRLFVGLLTKDVQKQLTEKAIKSYRRSKMTIVCLNKVNAFVMKFSLGEDLDFTKKKQQQKKSKKRKSRVMVKCIPMLMNESFKEIVRRLFVEGDYSLYPFEALYQLQKLSLSSSPTTLHAVGLEPQEEKKILEYIQDLRHDGKEWIENGHLSLQPRLRLEVPPSNVDIFKDLEVRAHVIESSLGGGRNVGSKLKDKIKQLVIRPGIVFQDDDLERLASDLEEKSKISEDEAYMYSVESDTFAEIICGDSFLRLGDQSWECCKHEITHCVLAMLIQQFAQKISNPIVCKEWAYNCGNNIKFSHKFIESCKHAMMQPFGSQGDKAYHPDKPALKKHKA